MKVISILFCLIVFSNSASAQDAGCGLGSIIFRDNTKLIQLFAMTTNHTIFFNQALGITFGTSHCTASGIALKEKEQIFYVELNYESLREELARGQGDHLEAFAGLLGCATSEMAEVSRRNFSEIAPQGAKPIEFLENTKKILRANPQTGLSCRHLG